MSSPVFRHIIASEHELKTLVGSPSEIAVAKQVRSLDDRCRAFVAHSPYVLLGTSNRLGRCDVSPKGDEVLAAFFSSLLSTPSRST